MTGLRALPLVYAMLLAPVPVLLGTCIAPALADTRLSNSSPAAPVAVLQPAPVDPAPQIILDAGAVAQGTLLHGRIVPVDARLLLDDAPVAVAPDGRFIVGFDRDHGDDAVLRLEPASGADPVERRLVVEAGRWAIQHVDAPARGAATSDSDFARRRPGEIAQMAAARRTVVNSDGWRQNFIWPVRGRISGVFGSQRVYRATPGSFHNGVDVAVPTGTPYVAPADGIVILAASEPFTLEGYLLMIDHGMGLSSVFLHSSRLDVRTGDAVRQGQVIGAVGATGRATGPHLHWAMRWQGAKIDAAQVAGPMPR